MVQLKHLTHILALLAAASAHPLEQQDRTLDNRDVAPNAFDLGAIVDLGPVDLAPLKVDLNTALGADGSRTSIGTLKDVPIDDTTADRTATPLKRSPAGDPQLTTLKLPNTRIGTVKGVSIAAPQDAEEIDSKGNAETTDADSTESTDTDEADTDAAETDETDTDDTETDDTETDNTDETSDDELTDDKATNGTATKTDDKAADAANSSDAATTTKSKDSKPSDPRQCWGSVQGQAAVECAKPLDQYLKDQVESAKKKADLDQKEWQRQKDLMDAGARNCTRSRTPDGKKTVETSKKLEDGTWVDKLNRECDPSLDFIVETTSFEHAIVRMCAEGDSRITGDKNPVDMVQYWLDSGRCVNGACPSGPQEIFEFDNITRQTGPMFWDTVKWKSSLKIKWGHTEAGYENEDTEQMFKAAQTGLLEAVKKMTIKKTIERQNRNDIGDPIPDGSSMDVYKIPQQIIYISKTLMGGTVQISIEFDSGSAEESCDSSAPVQQWLASTTGQIATTVIPGFAEFEMFVDGLFMFNAFFKGDCPANDSFGDIGGDDIKLKNVTTCQELWDNYQ